MWLRRTLTIAVCVFVWLTTTAPPASAQIGERIHSYDVVIDVGSEGVMRVTETIDYDFGANDKHGIYRYIPVRFRYDKRYDRVYKLGDIDVSGSPGTPTQTEISDDANNKVIRVGDADTTISGRHRYVISYTVRGGLNHFPDHDELYWNAIGHRWDVAMGRVNVTVRVPAPTTKIACFAGPERSVLPCARAGGEGTTQPTFNSAELAPFSGLTVVVAVPPGVISNVTPILDERWSIDRAFSRTTATVAGAGAVLALALLLVGRLLWRHGRDRRTLLEGATPVQYRPPDELRPAQVGVLVDESADPLDVTATIVDLAVRGYLTIEEVPDTGWFSKGDWRLARASADEQDLHKYEQRLLDGLFEEGDSVLLSDLKQKFYDDLKKIQTDLYRDTVKHKWFVRRPDHARAMWFGIGLVATLVSVGVVVLLAAFTHAALVGVPLVIAGLLLLVAHRRMPARTATGAEALQKVLGFRRFMTTAQTERMQFAEEEGIFAKYLPYAIVFGVTKQWANRFEGLDAGSPAMAGMGWYMGMHPFSPVGFSSSMNDFTVRTAGTIVSTPPSASGGSGFGGGGFSGGGGGGGGGGSW